jgi:hypothetical protein
MIKKITFDTYPITLYVFINQTDEDILAYMEKEEIDNIELINDILGFQENEHALFAYVDNYSNIAIRLRDLSKAEIVAHEALHATAFILRFVGIRFTKSSEEAYAYLLQYIIENIND